MCERCVDDSRRKKHTSSCVGLVSLLLKHIKNKLRENRDRMHIYHVYTFSQVSSSSAAAIWLYGRVELQKTSSIQNLSFVSTLFSIHVMKIVVYNILNRLDAAHNHCRMDLQLAFVVN